MTDLHKALTDECDKRERHREADFASFSWVDEEMPAMVPVDRLRGLLAEHPPTAPVVELQPAEHMALTFARAQLERDGVPGPNVAAVCVMALIRILDGGESDG